ncbi:MAG: hypothetical protein AB9866_03965 [Syntrophobacteraceae bacterium]
MRLAESIKLFMAAVAVFTTLIVTAPSFAGGGYYGHGYYGRHGGYYGSYHRPYYRSYYRPYYRPYYYPPAVSFSLPFPFFGFYVGP